jgi:hypothetical protein
MTVDWTDTTPRTLDELAATAFPSGAGITRDTLKRRIRQGALVAYRPGKAFLSSYAEVHAMMERLKVKVPRSTRYITEPSEATQIRLVNKELDEMLEDAIKRKRKRTR